MSKYSALISNILIFGYFNLLDITLEFFYNYPKYKFFPFRGYYGNNGLFFKNFILAQIFIL